MLCLAGIDLTPEDACELAGLLRAVGDDETAARLERARDGADLDELDRGSIVTALDDPPSTALARLRAALLADHLTRLKLGQS